jgi:4'-phosphopantetheinyl transferase
MPASAEGDWAPGPDRPLLADGEVHVWRADLESVAEEVCSTLSDDELARGARFVREDDGQRWRRSRAVLRSLLGRYLDVEAGSLCFGAGVNGKPELIEPAGTQLSFNLSHSGRTALYAFASSGAVGVDVEGPRRAFDVLAIASRELGSEEAQRLSELAPSEREHEFLRSWVRHEARLKCLGIGLGAAEGREKPSGLWSAELRLGADEVAAIAAIEPPAELRCWRWPERNGGRAGGPRARGSSR